MSDPNIHPVTDDALREEVRAWLAANWPGAPADGAAHRAWLAKVVEGRWAAPTCPGVSHTSTSESISVDISPRAWCRRR